MEWESERNEWGLGEVGIVPDGSWTEAGGEIHRPAPSPRREAEVSAALIRER